ncbi:MULTISPECIES: hypothetical protein [Limnobacter]|uniref:DUF2059 domain-containing protein n=1 Tax=Limnobacter litoralis TaxID=481366 RepID=A0ABQ5YUR7_9BURK|nr:MULTISPECIES: hypothetical protein [Limnobacter]GLR26653.1 hypothetical protein GCM10007875_17430 [Limnobacter litoralis]HEX5485087.1 hypothetical protein [Limnobacter sp.]
MTDEERNWLAADYALGVIRGAEKAAFETQLKTDPALAASVLDWQKRLSAFQPAGGVPYPTMSETEVDAALNAVFQRVFTEINTQFDTPQQLPNPLQKLSPEQISAMRPMVSRLLASYVVLLERLKIQQAKMAGAV